MQDLEYRKKYLNKRYAEDAEFRKRRKQCSKDYRAHKYATDPEWRAKESARCTGRMPEQSETGEHQA